MKDYLQYKIILYPLIHCSRDVVYNCSHCDILNDYDIEEACDGCYSWKTGLSWSWWPSTQLMVSQSMTLHLAIWLQVFIKTFIWSVLAPFLMILIVFIFYLLIYLLFIWRWLQLLVNPNQLSKAKVIVIKWLIRLFFSKKEQQSTLYKS